MKTRAKGAQVTKAKAPDPGAYGADDITPEDRRRAKDAKAQAADGKNPPNWVADEDTWSKAKEAAAKSYDEGDDAYWPAVVHIYSNMGGSISSKKAMQPKGKMKMVAGMMADMDMDAEMMADAAEMEMDRVEELMRGDDEPTDDEVSAMMSAMKSKTKKADHHHADMADVVAMMSEHEMSDADMVEMSGIDADRVKALMHDGAKPTDAELDSMMQACEECESDGEDMGKLLARLAKYGTSEGAIAGHATQGHNAEGGGGTTAEARERVYGGVKDAKEKLGRVRSLMSVKNPPEEAVAAQLRDAGMAASEAAGEAMMATRREGNDVVRSEFSSLANKIDKDVESLNATKDNAVRMKLASRIQSNLNRVRERTILIKCAEREVSSESLLKASLGMSDGEFRRLLSQAVYARWGKQAAVDEVFPETQVAVVKAWEGDVWASAYRLLSVPYDAEDGAVTLGEVNGEVRQTYEPVAKAAPEPDSSSCEVEYVADRDKRGEYVIDGLNGEAVTLAKSLSDAGVQARVEAEPNGADGAHRVVFASRGATCKQLAVRATVDGEFESEPRSFVPYLRNEVLIQKAEEKGIVYAVVYEPDVVDKQGEWATADDIEEAAHEYLRKSRRMKRQHDEHSDSEVVESYIAQADFFLGNRMVRKGSWVIAEKLGEKSKKLYKEGKLTGVSMGGHASYAA